MPCLAGSRWLKWRTNANGRGLKKLFEKHFLMRFTCWKVAQPGVGLRKNLAQTPPGFQLENANCKHLCGRYCRESLILKKDLKPGGNIEAKLCSQTIQDCENIEGGGLWHPVEDEDVPQSNHRPSCRGNVHMEGKTDILGSKNVGFKVEQGAKGSKANVCLHLFHRDTASQYSSPVSEGSNHATPQPKKMRKRNLACCKHLCRPFLSPDRFPQPPSPLLSDTEAEY